jgi:hypothetical protein
VEEEVKDNAHDSAVELEAVMADIAKTTRSEHQSSDASVCSDACSVEAHMCSEEDGNYDENNAEVCQEAYKRKLLQKDWIPTDVSFSRPGDDEDDNDDECSEVSDVSAPKRHTAEEEELILEARRFIDDCLEGKKKREREYLPWERYTTPEYILRNPLLR